jgi:hypothetical protein
LFLVLIYRITARIPSEKNTSGRREDDTRREKSGKERKRAEKSRKEQKRASPPSVFGSGEQSPGAHGCDGCEGSNGNDELAP